jgi:DNA invertase Pin-like site-specific DNA recombinase
VETIQPDGKRNPMISMLVSILTEFSVMERESLIERTKSGLAQAKRNGTKLGRPFGSKKSREQLLAENPKVVKLLKSNRSIREIAKLADRSVNTVIKVKSVMGR